MYLETKLAYRTTVSRKKRQTEITVRPFRFVLIDWQFLFIRDRWQITSFFQYGIFFLYPFAYYTI